MSDELGTIPETETAKPEAPVTASPEYAAELRAEAKQWRVKFQSLEKQMEKLVAEKERSTLEAKGDYEGALKLAQEKAAQFEEKARAAERYQEALTKLLATQRAGLPDGIIKLLDKLDPADQLEWIAENKATVTAQPSQQAQTNQAGQAAFNPVNGKQVETDKDRLARLNRQRGVISPFG
jgi:hypothetical protein